MEHLICFLASVIFAAHFSTCLPYTYSVTPTTLIDASYSISDRADLLIIVEKYMVYAY